VIANHASRNRSDCGFGFRSKSANATVANADLPLKSLEVKKLGGAWGDWLEAEVEWKHATASHFIKPI
jgi:hypothetical protein